MSKLKIILYSSQKSQRIIYQDNDGIMTSEIEQTYLRKCEIEHCNTAWARIIVSDKTRCALKELEQKYDTVTGNHIRKLYGFISKLSDGEVFYYLNEDKASVVERRTACDCVRMQHLGFRPVHNVTFHYYSMLDICFQYLSYGYDDGIEEWIGEEVIDKRVCRFCGKSYPEVNFDKVAHAVQDALGNKLLFCYEECDTCNHDLAPIEDNFRKIMDFRRAMYHIPRKGTTSTPKVVGKTFVIKPDSHGFPELLLMEESLPKGVCHAKPFYIHLELKDSMSNEGMYMALCKMVIDMLPSSELTHFENTIKWITSNGTWAPDSLPSTWLAVLPIEKVLYPQPVLDIFLNNKGQMPNSPYCTGIIWIYDIAYMFVMPFADVDAGQYKYDDDLVPHWQQMGNLIGIRQWQKQDSNNYLPSTPWVDWPVDLSQPNIHVLPKTDVVFEECLKQKVDHPDIDMPKFLADGISCNQVESADFDTLYYGKITDADLRDVTQFIAGPEFTVLPLERQVRVRLWVDANDTTGKIPYFKFSFDVLFDIPSFWDYVSLETERDGTLTSFAFHYDLRNYLYVAALANAEIKMALKRNGTSFEKCTLDNLLQCERIYSNAYYLVPSGTGDRYVKINDSAIHAIGCE